MRTSIISDACALRICVCVYFNLLWKLLDSYLYAGRSFLSDFLESLQETYHYVGQCFLYEIVKRQSITLLTRISVSKFFFNILCFELKTSPFRIGPDLT